EYRIRLAQKKDLPSLLDLMNQLSPYSSQIDYTEISETFSSILKDKFYRLIVYETNGKIVGTALLLVQKNLSHGGRPYGHIENVVVDSSYRGKGIGKEMLEYLINEAKKYNCYKVILNGRKGTEGFYESAGFKRTDETEMRIDL
ncbi:MAG: GNAT family N-acetyltransferase, partial [Nanoarchaeota archaeon]|nr:GNAT family N-acetyltransferase [Nanoarchaeota archaeon]